jgi:membrane protease YdiL (CAAX protease family)
VNVRIGRWWWGAAIPLAVAVVVVVLAVLFGATAPSSSDLAMAAAGALITLPIVLVINGPLGEELGWRGYVLPLFLRRHSPVMATILLIPLWICFHLPLIVTSPDRFGLWWALAVAGTAFPMTWLHLRSGGSVALAIGFHAVMNVATPAAVGLFAGPDRLLAMHLTAVVWVLIGLATAVGLLRRDPDPTDHDGVTRSQVQRLRRFARLLDRVMRKVDGELRVVGDRLRVELDDLSVVLGLAGVDAGAGLLDLLAPGTLDLLRPGYPHSATPSGCAAAAGGSRGRSRRRRSAAACGQ